MASWTNDVKQVLRENDCCFVRQGKGDHEFRHSPHSRKHFPADGKILSRHTANEIMKQAGLSHRFR